MARQFNTPDRAYPFKISRLRVKFSLTVAELKIHCKPGKAIIYRMECSCEKQIEDLSGARGCITRGVPFQVTL